MKAEVNIYYKFKNLYSRWRPLLPVFPFLFISGFWTATLSNAQSSVTVRDGWFWVDGQKFFVKGIGYETHTRPGQVPWEYSFDENLIRLDLARIRNAGFNTLRTWDALRPEELRLVEEFGLKVLMGIWVDPHGDYGNAAFVDQAVERVKEVVSYSANSPALLGYLIMNEPTVSDMVAGGPGNLRRLWERLIAEIHQLAPGVPVSVAQAAAGDFINTDLFDFVAFNLYIYNPLLLREVTGYAGYVEWLKRRLAPDKPLIITEFGLSVSPTGFNGPFGYGGNSLEQQSQGILLMYRGLIAGGAQGGCVFQYHDGWWKAGNPAVHDDHPEEWFGLFAFADSNDRIGSPRAAWDALVKFQQAIVLSPVMGGIYLPEIPVEVLISDPVTEIKIVWQHKIVARRTLSPGTYFRENIRLPVPDSLTAGELRLAFYDGNGAFLKAESYSCLIQQASVEFPKMELTLYPAEPYAGSTVWPVFSVTRSSGPVTLGDSLFYGFFPHIGFEAGESRAVAMESLNNTWAFTDGFWLPPESRVFSVGGAVDLRYKSWRKRLYRIVVKRINNWAEELAAPNPPETAVPETKNAEPPGLNLSVFPNPFNQSTIIQFSITQSAAAELTILNLLGEVVHRQVWQNLQQGQHTYVWDARNQASGVYFLTLRQKNLIAISKLLLIK